MPINLERGFVCLRVLSGTLKVFAEELIECDRRDIIRISIAEEIGSVRKGGGEGVVKSLWILARILNGKGIRIMGSKSRVLKDFVSGFEFV
ncbi:hypothetical protein TNIN_320601 [Trichonephila inaurata madagascariensis]|uniref:Uncharacterized protein n=1 Tax=Trichonephila inaurata madagascariensis TaxID=2747483 RepID=A0A8X6MIU5_9ARAC|nr:hypothetical protein TNIN_320601 [Trichonephila inaurata madagascariensis]